MPAGRKYPKKKSKPQRPKGRGRRGKSRGKGHRCVSAFGVVLISFVISMVSSAPAAEAQLFKRAKAASSAIFSSSFAGRGWVVTDPVSVDGGDVELMVLSVTSSDPALPAFIVRFQATDAAKVGREISRGDLLILTRYDREIRPDGLPVALARQGSWKTKRVKRASDTFAQWGYLVAARASANRPEIYERFIASRPGVRAMVEGDVEAVYKTAFGDVPSGEPQIVERVVEVPADCPASTPVTVPAESFQTFAQASRLSGGSLATCERTNDSLQAQMDDLALSLGRCETILNRAKTRFNRLEGSDALGHHSDIAKAVDEGKAALDEYFRIDRN